MCSIQVVKSLIIAKFTVAASTERIRPTLNQTLKNVQVFRRLNMLW